jgi:adhesin transport system membrane fusion protein
MSEPIEGKAERVDAAAQPTDVEAQPAPKPKGPRLPPAWKLEELSFDDGGNRRMPHALLATIVAFVVVGLLWAALADVDEMARGEGKVITASQTQLIQNLEGGIIEKILVKEGDLVQKDQVLFQLDDVRFTSAFREGRQGELGLRAKVARLTAEVQKTAPVMPPDVEKGAPALAANELAVYAARQRDVGTKTAVLREQLAQRRQEVLELHSKRDRTQEQIELLKQEIAITAPMVKLGAVSEVEVLRLERDSARLRTELEAATLAIPRAQAAIEEVRRKIDDSEAQYRSQAAAELSQARNELAKVAETVPALEDRVARTQVRSPVRGVIKTIANKTPGGVVQPGTPLAEVVAVEDTLLIEGRMRPQDIAFVSVGQKASVKLGAYDYSIYGAMDGKVEMVSADSTQPQPQQGQGTEPYYIVHVRTTKSAIEYQGKVLPVIPGMTAQVDVLTGKKSVLYYWLKPLNKARQRAMTER